MKASIKIGMASLLSAAMLLPCLATAASAADPADAVSRQVADYSGKGSVIAVIDVSFDASHPVFAHLPTDVALTKEAVSASLGEDRYRSDKLPLVWDYAGGDADVTGTSYVGTAAASLAAGHYLGARDIEAEDGSVTHENDYFGAAPDAQLLLMKAAPDGKSVLSAEAAAAALRDAVSLGADAILLRLSGVTADDALTDALAAAKASGIPVLAGTGESGTHGTERGLPATYTDRGTLADYADLDALTLVGAAADPYTGISAFHLRQEGEEDVRIPYTDSCADYFGKPFAALIGGQTLDYRIIPGVGTAADYQGIDCTGAVAVVRRGEISFSEKALAAADAGAIAMLVINTEGDSGTRMALEDAPIPAVLLGYEALALLSDASGASLVFPAGKETVSDSSAFGVNRAFTRTPAFLARGEYLTAAIPLAENTETPRFATVTGTHYAAASAAGYIARAAQFCRAAGLDDALALSLTAGSALPALAPSGGLSLSPRLAGRGIVSDTGVYPTLQLSDTAGMPVGVLGTTRYSSKTMQLRLTNPDSGARVYTLRAHLFRDGYTIGDDGVARLSGESVPLSGAEVYIGDSSRNLAEESGITLTLGAGQTLLLELRIRMPDAVRQELQPIFWNGFYADCVLSLTDAAGEELLYPISGFWGEWADAPLADAMIYDGETPVFGAATLHTLRPEINENYRLVLGQVNPYIPTTPFSPDYNTVNPEFLRYGWIELHLCALRDIDRVTVTFYDSERRVIFSNEAGSVKKYLRAGEAVIPLWDFIATDNREYVFPDGEYACEVRLSADCGSAGDAVQFLGFTLTVDSLRPTASSITAWRDGNAAYLRFTAEDETALWTVSAYDTVYTFAETNAAEAAVAGQETAMLTYDITQYDSMGPLYIEVTDRAGNYRVYRFSAEEIAALLAATEGEGAA